jgi:hypothetical protein
MERAPRAHIGYQMIDWPGSYRASARVHRIARGKHLFDNLANPIYTDIVLGPEFTCGYLTVSRRIGPQSDSRTIRLAVATRKAAAPSPKPVVEHAEKVLHL